MIKAWFEFAKAQKEIWVNISKGRGDMPPFVIAERANEPPLIIVAPQVDKNKALQAANLCRVGMDCDALAIITDGYGIRGGAGGPRKEQMEIYDQIREEFGTLQDAFLAGNPNVIEVITAIRYNPDKTMSMAGAEYTIENKKVIWGRYNEIDEEEPHEPEDDEDVWKEFIDTKKGPLVGGYVADAIRKIMKLPSLLGMAQMQDAAKICGIGDNVEKQLYHSGRAIRKVLHQEHFLIMECVPWKKEEGYGVLLQKMKEKYDKIGDIYDVDKMETKPEFLQKYYPSMN